MRNHGPIAQRECPMQEGQALVSTTDRKSRLVDRKPSFVEVRVFKR